MTKSSGPAGAFANGAWASALSAVQTGAGTLVSLLLIVVLPVEDYGVYSYAMALVAIGMAVAQGGLASLAVRLLVDDDNRRSSLMSAILATRLSFALVGYLLIVAISLTSGEFPTIAAVLIAGSALVPRAANVANFWYQARMRNRVVSGTNMVVVFILLGVRLLALVLWPNVWVFLSLFVVEAVLSTGIVWLRFMMDRTAPRLGAPRKEESAEILRGSVPLTLSGLANQVNLRGDVIVIQALLGTEYVGIYAVATRIAELASMLPTAFLNATLPVMIASRREHGSKGSKYLEVLQKSYDNAFWIGVGFTAVFGVAGTVIIRLAFDPVYEAAIPILWLQLATCPFMFMAIVYSKWIVTEGVYWLSLIRHIVGAIINIVLNFVLIPHFGLFGAAIATLVSYIFASYASCFLSRRSLLPAKQMTFAMLAPIRVVYRRLRKGR